MTALRIRKVLKLKKNCVDFRREGLDTGLCMNAINNEADTHAETTVLNALTLFGRVIHTVPQNAQSGFYETAGEPIVCKFQKNVLEFGVKCRTESHAPKYPDRDIERSHKSGFEMLRLTFNLARGDLEQAYV